MARTKKTEGEAPKKKATAAPVVEQEPVVEAAPVAEPVQAVAEQQVNMVVEQKAPPVTILYIDSAIPNNEIKIGRNRSIFGSGRFFTVPMEQFEGEFMTSTIMELIAQRKLIVLKGLTDEERKLYNCYYGKNEVLRGEGMFDFFFNMDTAEAAAKFEALCPEHQQLVATRFMDAYFEKHDNRVTRDKVEELNRISKAHFSEGLFKPLVEAINEKIVKGA